jgi:UDP-N-acetylmuramoylalanine--D-glutamate ligase
MNKKPLLDNKVGVIGLGRSGIAAANLAKQLGADVLVSESRAKEQSKNAVKLLKKGIKIEYGGHSSELLKSSVIIKSPGVHGDIPVIRKAKALGISIIGEIEFALKFIKSNKVIAITGTNGKTTTTTLVGEILKAAGIKTIVAGNIGYPPAAAVAKITSSSSLVLEISSYQLEDSPAFKPHISAILNITPDHLEHHGTMKNYIAAKQHIFENQAQGDYCVLNYEDKILKKIAAKCPAKIIYFSRSSKLKGGVYFSAGRLVSDISNNKFAIDLNLRIPGPHNIENALAAAAIAAAAGVKPEIIKKVLNSFKGVEHRIEFIGEISGVKYFNDSKGTNVDSTRVALESFNKNIWLILGGLDKGAPYTPLRGLINMKVKGVLLIGQASAKIKKGLAGSTKFYDCGTLARAVKLSSELAVNGDIVLLSPACASFDQFKDYEDRGRQFKKLVSKIIS